MTKTLLKTLTLTAFLCAALPAHAYIIEPDGTVNCGGGDCDGIIPGPSGGAGGSGTGVPGEPEIYLERVEVTGKKDNGENEYLAVPNNGALPNFIDASDVTLTKIEGGGIVAMAAKPVIDITKDAGINETIIKKLLEKIEKLPKAEQAAAIRALAKELVTLSQLGYFNARTLEMVTSALNAILRQGGFATLGSLLFGLSAWAGAEYGVFLNNEDDFLRNGGGADIIEYWFPLLPPHEAN